jgi:dTDP-glucose 4,6-dehydratase
MIKRVLLTGAGGFVGSHMLRHLLANTDWDVVCPVTFRHRGLNDRIRLAMDDMPDAAHRVHVVRCDLATPISVVSDAAFGPIDAVVNFASESHVDRSIHEPAEFILNNVALMVNLLDWARYADLEAFIQISTDEVYGPAERGKDHREWVDLHMPSNPYSASKAAQEDIAFAYWRTYDLPIVLTNTMNIIGETQDPEKFVPLVLRKMLAGERVDLHAGPEGLGSRSYLHARNQADAVLWVLRHHTKTHTVDFGDEGRLAWDNALDEETGESLRYGDGGGRPYRWHVTGEREVDNLAMLRMIARAAEHEIDYRVVDDIEERPGHDLRYALDGRKIADAGWKAPVPLDESLERTVKWTLAHPEWLRA